MGYPVIIMDWIDGQPLDWEVIRHHTEAKTKVLAQLADYIFNLSTLTESHEVLEALGRTPAQWFVPCCHINVEIQPLLILLPNGIIKT